MRISPQLQPYVSLPPKDSLVLVTGVLGATSNWLVVRFLCAAFAENKADDVAVVFVSFLRDFDFWKVESRRSGGLDLARLAEQKRFAFVDGLNGLFLPKEEALEPPAALPARQSLIANHGPPLLVSNMRSAPTRPAMGSVQRVSPSTPSSTGKPQNGRFILTSPTTDHLEEITQQAIEHVSTLENLPSVEQSRKILLVLDSPDALLAAATPFNTSQPMDLNAGILQVRSLVNSAVVACAADMPLLSTSASSTPLETNHAAFVTRLAHSASYTMSLRLLDTGFAADVSGVLRITRGSEEDSLNVEEKELLYYVGGDSSVKVFERGASTTS